MKAYSKDTAGKPIGTNEPAPHTGEAIPFRVARDYAKHYGVSGRDLENGRCRSAELLEVRKAIAVAMSGVWGFSLRQIGHAMGTDHVTTLRRIEAGRKLYPQCAEKIRARKVAS